MACVGLQIVARIAPGNWQLAAGLITFECLVIQKFAAVCTACMPLIWPQIAAQNAPDKPDLRVRSGTVSTVRQLFLAAFVSLSPEAPQWASLSGSLNSSCIFLGPITKQPLPCSVFAQRTIERIDRLLSREYPLPNLVFSGEPKTTAYMRSDPISLLVKRP